MTFYIALFVFLSAIFWIKFFGCSSKELTSELLCVDGAQEAEFSNNDILQNGGDPTLQFLMPKIYDDAHFFEM